MSEQLRPIVIPGTATTGASPGPAHRLLFCDRDGVIIANRSTYVLDRAEVEPLHGAAAALRRANGLGFDIVIVSNQSAVGRGLLDLRAAVDIHRHVVDDLADQGVRIRASYLCPHAPWQGCACRKPAPGMATAALEDAGHTAPSRCAFVGDAVEDMRAARAAGIPGFLVRTGRGRSHEAAVLADADLRPTTVVADLAAAVASLGAQAGPDGPEAATGSRG